MIPGWSTNGDLPPGVHFATWQELEDRLTFNPRRQRMLAGFRLACEELRKAGCRPVGLTMCPRWLTAEVLKAKPELLS